MNWLLPVGLFIGSVIVGALLGKIAAGLGRAAGREQEKNNLREFAVNAGFGVWEISRYGAPNFRWLSTNEVMSKTWTRRLDSMERPTEEGYYWARTPEGDWIIAQYIALEDKMYAAYGTSSDIQDPAYYTCYFGKLVPPPLCL